MFKKSGTTEPNIHARHACHYALTDMSVNRTQVSGPNAFACNIRWGRRRNMRLPDFSMSERWYLTTAHGEEAAAFDDTPQKVGPVAVSLPEGSFGYST
jgi:hypothetical protein